MALWNEGIKFGLPGLFAALGAALAVPILLPVLARITRPAAKEAVRFYFDLADDVREVVAHHQVRRGKPAGLFHEVLRTGGEELVTQGLEVGAEETLSETVLEGIIVEIL
jgi:hypothetical protein